MTQAEQLAAFVANSSFDDLSERTREQLKIRLRDNLGAVLAAAEYSDADGREFLTALAVAYQVQCRLSDAAPVRDQGFDHTTQGAYAVAAGVARALRLDIART